MPPRKRSTDTWLRSRGRSTLGAEYNTMHLVAGDADEARPIFTDGLRRESGNRGVEAWASIGHSVGANHRET